MATFWITFRIAEVRIGSKTYEERYDSLMKVIDDVGVDLWSEPTSFIAFSSDKNINDIATACKRAIAPSHDLFLIRAMDTKSAKICGKNEDKSIFALMPYLKSI